MGSTVVAFGVIGRSVVQQFGDVVQRPIVVEDADFAPFARTLVVDGVGVFGDSSTARTGITSSQGLTAVGGISCYDVGAVVG